jgi:hypothetical protein
VCGGVILKNNHQFVQQCFLLLGSSKNDGAITDFVSFIFYQSITSIADFKIRVGFLKIQKELKKVVKSQKCMWCYSVRSCET